MKADKMAETTGSTEAALKVVQLVDHLALKKVVLLVRHLAVQMEKMTVKTQVGQLDLKMAVYLAVLRAAYWEQIEAGMMVEMLDWLWVAWRVVQLVGHLAALLAV